jgi:quinolinate synthase
MYNRNSDEERCLKEIKKIKKEMGEKLLILAHHYQRVDIVELGDFIGDSFELSRRAARSRQATNIVFCGVHFMAESAAILAEPRQVVQIPDEHAGCPMADMADIRDVQQAWNQLASVIDIERVMPIVYMNSNAGLKAFCGRNGGLVCTSSNAPAAFEWAFGRKEKVFFFPDQHLGRNTGNQKGFSREEIILWDPQKPLGGNSRGKIKDAKIILWNGYCNVHTHFKIEHVHEMRRRFPEARIVVHPECSEEVVALSDAVGSTGYIVKYVKDAAPGETIVVGTEINLVKRLAMENREKNILELSDSLCPDMSMIDPKNLLWALENLGKVNIVTVADGIKEDARKALERMLDLPH